MSQGLDGWHVLSIPKLQDVEAEETPRVERRT